MGGKRELIRRSWMLLKDLSKREADWYSYEVACKEDPDLKSFDADVQSRTTKVISTLQNGGVSTDYVSEAIAYVTEFNKHTVEAIRVCREDITSGVWKNKKKKMKSEESFWVVVEEYVHNSEEMLDFCSVLDKFLKSARNNHFEIEQVIQQCEMETDPEGGNKYVRISKKLKSLKASAHHYDSANRLLEKIQSLQAKNKGLIHNLKNEYEKLANKQKSVRAWRKVVNIIFITIVATQFISAVAMLAMANPAAAAVAGTITPVISGHQCVLDLLTEYEKFLDDDNVILQTMHGASVSCISELGDVKFLIDKVVNEMDAVLFHDCHADSAMAEGQVENAIKNIKSKLDMFLKKIEDLEEKGETCSSEVLKSRDEVRSMMNKAWIAGSSG